MKRTYTVTFPDGTTASRSTETMRYRFAIITDDNGSWGALSWSQSERAAMNTANKFRTRGFPNVRLAPAVMVKGAEVEWHRDEARGVMECIVTATTNPAKWPVGSILNTLAL